MAANPNWKLEGPAFYTLPAASTDLSPVYRFRNKVNGSYLYTAYESEKTDIQGNYGAIYELEGVAWRAQQTEEPGYTALYRFRNLTNGTYLNTAYAAEKDAIVRDYPLVFKLEGVAYYVHQDGPPLINLVTDTGITAAQCYGVGSDVLISCTSADAIALNDKQDGMVGRDVTSPVATDGALGLSYTAVAGGCVKDNFTGLVWEGKTKDGGLRDENKGYTNYDNLSAFTQAQIDAGTNSIGFKNAVNASNLCGYNDWRLPTVKELQSIANYGETRRLVDPAWFPLPAFTSTFYWSSTPDVRNPSNSLGLRFNAGDVKSLSRSDAGSSSFGNLVRLVR